MERIPCFLVDLRLDKGFSLPELVLMFSKPFSPDTGAPDRFVRSVGTIPELPYRFGLGVPGQAQSARAKTPRWILLVEE